MKEVQFTLLRFHADADAGLLVLAGWHLGGESRHLICCSNSAELEQIAPYTLGHRIACTMHLAADQNEWAKHTEHERAVRSTLLFAGACVPPSQRGKKSDAFAELIDIYPTLADLAGIPVLPLCPLNSSDVDACSEGASLAPIIRDGAAQVKNASYFQWPKTVGNTDVMGYGLRTDDFHYVTWVAHDRAKRVGNFSDVFGEELYNLADDPWETVNLAVVNKTSPSVISALEDMRWLAKAGWRIAQTP